MKYLYGIAALVALIVIAAFVVPLFMDWGSYRPEISKRVEALTGRKLAIDGDISVALLPSPTLRIEDVRLANLPGASVPDMARLKALELHVALGPLLSGEIQVTSLSLVDPVIQLEQMRDGSNNWTFTPPAEPADASSTGEQARAAGDAGDDDGAGVQLDSLEIKNGTIVYLDGASGRTEHLHKLDAELSARSLEGPFRGNGSFEARDLPVEFRLATGALSSAGVLSATIELEVGEKLVSVHYEGTLARETATTAAAAAGSVKFTGENLLAVLSAAKFETDEKLHRLFTKPFSIKADVSGAATAMQVKDLQIRLGDTLASGEMALEFGDQTLVDAVFQVNRIDLDTIIKVTSPTEAEPKPGQRPDEASSGAIEAVRSVASEVANEEDLVALVPEGVAGSLSVSIDAVKYRDGVVRQARAQLGVDEGVVTIEQASALLPGGADVVVFGQVSPEIGGAVFDGRVEMGADDLRALANWLSLDLSGVPADRLRRFSATAAVKGNVRRLKADDIDMRVDSTRLTGSAGYEREPKASIVATLAIDQLNADAYLGVKPGTPTPVSEPAAAGEAATSESPDRAEPAAVSQSLAVGEWVNTELKLSVGNLVYQGVRITDLVIDGSLFDGLLTLHQLDAADAAGAQFAAHGTLRDLQSVPAFDFTFDAEADSLSRVTQALALDTDLRQESLGRVSLKGTLAGTASDLRVNIDLDTGPADAKVVGTIVEVFTSPRFNLGLRLRTDDTANLLRIAGMQPSAMMRRVGALSVDGGFEGDLSRVTVNLGAEALGATLQMAGAITDPRGALGYDLNLALSHPSYAAFSSKLTGKTRQGGDTVGPIRMTGHLIGDGNAADLSNLVVAMGETAARGALFARLDGPKPVVKADLRANYVDADLLFGGAATAARPQGAEDAGGGRASGTATAGTRGANDAAAPSGQWSRVPIDLSALQSVDADVTLGADSLRASGYQFDRAELNLSVIDGVLKIHSLRGLIFGGTLEAEGEIADAAIPQAKISFLLRDADIAPAIRQAAGVEVVTGQATIDGRFTTRGATEYDIVSGLNGDATISARDGTVEGVNLEQISQQLGSLNGAASFLALANASFSGGTTRLHSLDGTIQVRNGLAETRDTRLVADRGEGTVQGQIDLPGWRMDLTAQFRLTDHPKAPPIGVHLTGPVDAPRQEILAKEMQAFLFQRAAGELLDKTVIPKIKLREGASAEPGTAADLLLRGLLGDPDKADSEPASDGAPPLAPQNGTTATREPAPQQPAKQQKPEPEQLIRGLLDSLTN